MRLNKSLGHLVALAAVAATPSALATPYDTLSSIAGTYNMFLLGNLGTASSPFLSDAVGSVAVAGNAYLSDASVGSGNASASLVVGGNLSQTGGSTAGNVYVGGNLTSQWTGYSPNLVVGGNATMSGGQSGNVFVGGDANISAGVTIGGNLTMTGANAALNASSNGGSSPQNVYIAPATTVNDPSYWSSPKTSGAPATPTTPIDVYGSSTDIINASKSLAALNATTISSSGGILTIALTQNGLNVIDLSMLSGSTINGITVVTANGVTPTGLILNVAGDNLTFNGGTFNPGSLTDQSVLFNFSNATNLNLTSLAFEGSLLAPLATVNFTGGNIDGTLIANNYYGSGELHEAPFTLTLPAYKLGGAAATPEPTSLALLAGGFTILAVAARRRAASPVRS
jgi:choice-of-anchor A domain-containing protein